MDLENTAFELASPSAERVLIDANQIMTALQEQQELLRSRYAGSMQWKSAKGRDYLLRTLPGQSSGRSLGPRDAQTEKIHAAFHEGRTRAREREQALRIAAREQGRLVRSVGFGRMPTQAAAVIRALTRNRVPHRVVGTHALFAYEVMGAVRFGPGLTATQDVDILMDSRKSLKLAVGRDASSLIQVLRQASRSFALSSSKPYRALNDAGFMVDIIVPPPPDPLRHNENLDLANDDLQPAEIEKLEWLVSAPIVKEWAYDLRGESVLMTVPDPRAFAIHKAWVAQSASREPAKARRDRAQAEAVLQLLQQRLSTYQLEPGELKKFPLGLVNSVVQA